MHRFLVAVDYILPERSIKYFLCFLSVKLDTVSLSVKELAWRVLMPWCCFYAWLVGLSDF